MKKRDWILGSIGGLCLLFGVWLAARAVIGPTVPDVATATPEQVAQFMASGQFDRLSSSQRKKLLGDAAARYYSMPQQEREAFERAWDNAGLEREQKRKIESQVDFAMACRVADEFAALDPQEQGPYLDRLLFIVQTVGGGEKFMRWVESNPAEQIIRDPMSINQLGGFQRKLINDSSAEQRASFTKLGGALLDRAKRYR